MSMQHGRGENRAQYQFMQNYPFTLIFTEFLAAKCSTINHSVSKGGSKSVSLKLLSLFALYLKNLQSTHTCNMWLYLYTYIYPKKLQFVAYGQFVLVFSRLWYLNLTCVFMCVDKGGGGREIEWDREREIESETGIKRIRVRQGEIDRERNRKRERERNKMSDMNSDSDS